MEELKPAKEKIETGKAQLLDAQTELDAAKAQIEQQKKCNPSVTVSTTSWCY